MRLPILIIGLFFLLIFFAGCSSSKDTPVQPLVPESSFDSSGTGILYSGTFDIDLETQTISLSDRQSDVVYDITGFLPDKCPGGCFRYQIVNVVGSVLEIELTIENPLNILVHDVRIQYKNLFGKTVLNPDSYTDFLGTPVSNIFPFTAFAKENPDRAFPVGPGGIDTETLFLDFPPGSQSAVNYSITAHLPGQTPEPYEIDEMSQTGVLTTTGGSATISCRVDDHQNNISAVYFDATPFTGVPVRMSYVAPNYEVVISNTQGAPQGTYNQLIMALSPNSQHISTYNYVEVTVSGSSSDDPVAIISPPCPVTMILVNQSLFFDGRLSYDDIPPIAGYAWDFNWDENPANFHVDSTLNHLIRQFTELGIYTIGLRVEDTDGNFGYASVEVTVAVEIIPPGWHQEVLVEGWDGVEAVERNYGAAHQVVADCDGVVHMIYKFSSNTGNPQSGLYYVNFDGFTMGTPEFIGGGSGGLYQPTLRLDNQGDLHMTYYFVNKIYYCKRTRGSWSYPEVIVDTADIPGYSIEYPTMAVNYSGDIMVAFGKINSGYVWYLGYVMNDGSGWSAPQDINELYLRIDSSSYKYPNEDIQAAPDGTFHLVYVSWPNETAIRDYDLWHVIYDGAGWGATNKFNDDPGSNIALASYMGSDGDLFAIWQSSRFGTFNVMYQRYDGFTETWGSSIRVSRNPLSDDYSFIPDAIVDNNGLVMYLWEYYDGSMRHVYYKTFDENDSASSILNADEIEIGSGAWNRTNPNIFFKDNVSIHLIYEDDRANPGNYSARDMYYNVWR
ncbi:hypothetical protein KKB99_03205 [bacterium]|nr:hypothetical protein [bacterium]MBU1024998.1 hypothetical protein [bacterium]